jgi:hypothetical protein
MPYSFRHLPGKAGNLIDTKSLPKNTVLFNPSIAHPILYLRTNAHSAVDERNSVTLYNVATKKLTQIDTPWNDLKKTVNLFKGIEDLRICWFNRQLWFAGTCTHASDNMTSELIVGFFDKSLAKVEKISAVDIGSLPVKNMTLYTFNDKLYMLDVYLKAIYEITEEFTHENDKKVFTKFVATKYLPLKCGSGIKIDDLRGSTCPVHLHGNTWGCIVHDIIFNDQTSLVTRLSYLHIWMEFDALTGVVTFLSSPFWICQWGIEYCSGMYLHEDGNTVDLYLGVNDQTCAIYNTTLFDLRVGK